MSTSTGGRPPTLLDATLPVVVLIGGDRRLHPCSFPYCFFNLPSAPRSSTCSTDIVGFKVGRRAGSSRRCRRGRRSHHPGDSSSSRRPSAAVRATASARELTASPVDGAGVAANRVGRDEQPSADVAGREIGCQQPEHRELRLGRPLEHVATVGARARLLDLELDARRELRERPGVRELVELETRKVQRLFRLVQVTAATARASQVQQQPGMVDGRQLVVKEPLGVDELSLCVGELPLGSMNAPQLVA